MPSEANTPLLVDPNTVLARPITPQRFQSVTGRGAQERQGGGRVDQVQLSFGTLNDNAWQALHKLTEEQGRRSFIGKRPNHDTYGRPIGTSSVTDRH